MDRDPLLGRTIAGRYRVTGKIGVGGMGTVYAATQDPLGRPVAVKVLKPSFAKDEIVVARFKKEAAIVSGLNHPNIVTLHDYGETDDGLLYIVMEYLRGSTLSLVVKSQGAMPWRRTIPIVQDIARGLSVAHAAGVIHRDLKLDNIIVLHTDDDRDFIKILDFGVAKTVGAQDGTPTLTETDASPGTPGYMSPELARGITHDPRSDLYALGVVWFELLAGRRPFLAKNAMDVFLHQMTLPTPSVREAAPAQDIPEAIDALIQKLLDKDPAKRPADTAALLDATFALDEELPTSPRTRRISSKEAERKLETPTSPTGEALFLPTLVGAPPPPTIEPDPSLPAHIATETMVAALPPTAPTAPPPPRSSGHGTMAVALSAAAIAVVLLVALSRKAGLETLETRQATMDAHLASAPALKIEIHKPVSVARDAPAGRGLAPRRDEQSEPTPAPVEVAPPPAPPPAPPLAPSPPPDPAALRSRLEDATARMRERMLLPDDVPGYRRLTVQVEEELNAGRASEAAKHLDELDANLAATRLTDAFINKKLARVNANFPDGWPTDPAQKQELMTMRADVHERFGAGDLPGANLALNKLWLYSLKARLAQPK